MNKQQTKIQTELYEAPKIVAFAFATMQCIAQSPDGYNPQAEIEGQTGEEGL